MLSFDDVMHDFLFILFAYLLGSVPAGVLLAKLKGRDPRLVGSGNIGATNVMRTAGKTLGIATLAGDTVKGILPVWLALYCNEPKLTVAATGFAAFSGHLFPVYLKFRGGKGIATSLGIFLVLAPLAVLIDAALFFLLLAKWRYVSLGSLACTALMPVIFLILGVPMEYVLLSLLMGILIYWKHRENIRRLMAGKENRIGGYKRQC